MLHLAVIFENRLAVRHLLKVINMFPVLKCCLNDQNKMKQTALHLAVNLNLAGVVEELILAGAELDLQDINGNTPFHIACKKGLLQCMDVFLSIVNSEKLRKIAELTNNEGEKLQCLLRSGVLLTNHFAGYNALHLAVTQSNVKVIRRLCNIGCDINMQVSSQHIQWGMISGIYLDYLFSMWQAFIVGLLWLQYLLITCYCIISFVGQKERSKAFASCLEKKGCTKSR